MSKRTSSCQFKMSVDQDGRILGGRKNGTYRPTCDSGNTRARDVAESLADACNPSRLKASNGKARQRHQHAFCVIRSGWIVGLCKTPRPNSAACLHATALSIKDSSDWA